MNWNQLKERLINSRYYYFHTDNGVLLCGDCLKVLPLIPDESIDLVVTSPPYNIGIDYGICKDNLEWNEYLSWNNKWINEIYKVLRDDGRFVLNVLVNVNSQNIRQQPLLDFGNLIRKNKLKIHAITFWIDATRVKYTAWGSWKSASMPYIYNPFEAIIISYKNSWKKLKKGKDTISKEDFIKGVSGIYNFGTEKRKFNPAPFPYKLPALFIELLTFKDEVVLDPFIGSGTTAVACERLNRRWIGIEINPEYCGVTKQRVLREIRQLKIF